MAYDKVKPLKIESADTGGTQDDQFPTSLDPQEDYIEVRGLVLDDASNKDETTVLDRNGDNMQFKDVNNPTPVTLTDLLGGAAASLLGKAIFTVDGGLIYSSAGDVQLKVSE